MDIVSVRSPQNQQSRSIYATTSQRSFFYAASASASLVMILSMARRTEAINSTAQGCARGSVGKRKLFILCLPKDICIGRGRVLGGVYHRSPETRKGTEKSAESPSRKVLLRHGEKNSNGMHRMR